MLQGKHALVTGSRAGLGFAIAKALVVAGTTVTLNDRCTPGEGEVAANALAAETGGTTVFHAADLSQQSEVEAMMHAAARRFGGVDIVVNNAVIRHFSAVETFDPASWNVSLAVNLSAAFHTARLALPHMKRREWGRIINISSIYGLRGAENRVDYVTTKTGLIGLTRAIALETAKTGVTCNSICPCTVPSRAILDRIAEQASADRVSFENAERAYLATRQPTGRFVALESVAATVVFLCSPAGADITGTTLPVDGGWQAI
jgi:3-hydroxybutyrate dehydrogenase